MVGVDRHGVPHPGLERGRTPGEANAASEESEKGGGGGEVREEGECHR